MRNLLIYIFLSFFVSHQISAQMADINMDDLSSLISEKEELDHSDILKSETKINGPEVSYSGKSISEWPRCLEPQNLKLKKSSNKLFAEWDDDETQTYEYEIKFISGGNQKESDPDRTLNKSYEIELNSLKDYSAVSVRRVCETQNGTIIYSGWTQVDIELASSILSPTVICDILSYLTITVMSDGTIFIYLPGPNFPDDFATMLDELGLTAEEYEDILNDWPDFTTTTIEFTDAHGEGYIMDFEIIDIWNLVNHGMYIDISAAFANYNGSLTYAELAAIGSFTFTWIDENGVEQDCTVTPTVIDQSPNDDLTPMTLECGAELDESPVSTEINLEVVEHELLTINHFPFYIDNITSNNNGIISGTGKLVLPFSDLEVFVNLNSIKVNVEGQVFEGSVTGIDGQGIPAFPNYNLPPIYIGGDICVPPPNVVVPDKNGFDQNGINGYGFDSLGNHFLTTTKFDPNGFDINGNQANGNPYNDSGCDRDGFLWEGDPMAQTTKPCDPSGGAADPQDLSDFVNSGILGPNGKLKKVREVFDDLKEALETEQGIQSGICDGIRDEFNDAASALSSCETSVKGENNSLVESGMSGNFIHPPKVLEINGATKNATTALVEEKHIALYGCDLELTKMNRKLEIYDQIDSDFEPLQIFVRDKLDKISSSELEIIKNSETAYYAWVEKILQDYILDFFESEGIVFEQNRLIENTNLDNGYSAVASNGIIEEPVNKIDQIQFQYEQGFDLINGIPRPFYMEELKNQQEAMALSLGLNGSNSYQPLKFSHELNNWEFSFYFDDISITPAEAKFNVALVVKNLDTNQKFAVGANNLIFEANGNVEGELGLFNTVGIRLINSARLLIKPQGTSIKFNCEGFESITLNASVEFCREHITPLINDATGALIADPETDNRYELDLPQISYGWMDFYLELNAPPFALTKLDGYIFELGKMNIDMSSSQSPSGLENIPPLYESPYFNNGSFDHVWKGFYAADLKVTFPNFITRKNNNGTGTGSNPNTDQLQVNVQSLIFDPNGGSSLIEFSDPNSPFLDFDSGNAGGWQFSIDGVNIAVVHNQIVGGGFGGEVGIPILKNPIDYSATMLPGNGILLSVYPGENNEMPLFKSKAFLKKTTFVKGSYSFDPEEEKQNFELSASLDGHIEVLSDFDIKNIKLPTIKFQGVKFANHGEDRFSPGEWGVQGLTTGQVFQGYGLTIQSIYAGAAKDGSDRLELEVAAKLDIVEDKLWAGGKFAMYGHQYTNPEGFDKWGFHEFKVKAFCIGSNFGSKIKLEGCVEWFENKIENGVNYGDGFRGALTGELIGLGLDIVGQFGRVDDKKYFFIDMMIDLPGDGIPLGIVTLERAGGGFVYGMTPDYTNIIQPTAQSSFTADPASYLLQPVGTTMTGVKYVPSGMTNKEIKLLCAFHAVKDDLVSGTGELIFRFNEGFSFDEIELRAQVQLLKALSESEKELDPNASEGSDKMSIDSTNNTLPLDSLNLPIASKYSSPFKGFLSLKYNFGKDELHGQIAAFLDAGLVYGRGKNKSLCFVDMYYQGKDNWYLWVGEPENRAGAKVDLGLASVDLSAYLNIGTEVPAFPGLPEDIKHLGRDLTFNEAIRSSGGGFAFGASLKAVAGKIVLGTGAKFELGLGFDVMMKKINNARCKITDEDGNITIKDDFGIRKWYALGQAWAYIGGEVKIAGKNILSAGAAAVLQLQAPNPTWGYAALELSYSAIGGSSGTWTGDAEFGDRCVFIPENGDEIEPSDLFGMTIVKSVSPYDGEEGIPINGNLKAEFVVDIGKPIEDYVIPNEGNKTVTFEIDEEITGIYDESGFKYEADLIYVSYDLTNLELRPKSFLPINRELELRVAVKVFLDGVEFFTETNVSMFKTDGEFLEIPESNIVHAYPINGMSNFYKSEQSFGFIQLDRLQPSLFYFEDEYDDEGNVKYFDLIARFTNNGSVHLESKVKFNPLTNRVEFEMEPTELSNSTIYKLELVKTYTQEYANLNVPLGGLESNTTNASKDDGILYTSYFRTSIYNTFDEKFNALVINAKPQEGSTENYVAGAFSGFLAYTSVYFPQETFDAFELYGTYVGYGEESNALFRLSGIGNNASYTDPNYFRAIKDGEFYLMNGAVHAGCESYTNTAGIPEYSCGASIGKTSIDQRLMITQRVYTSNSFTPESGEITFAYLMSNETMTVPNGNTMTSAYTYKLPDGNNSSFDFSGIMYTTEPISVGLGNNMNDIINDINTILKID